MPFARPIALARVELPEGSAADYALLTSCMAAEGYVSSFERGSMTKRLPRGAYFSYKHGDKVMAMSAAKRAAAASGFKHQIFLLIGEAKDCTDFNLDEEKTPSKADGAAS